MVLPNAIMNNLIESKFLNKPFGRDMLILRNKLNKQDRKYPCDYIVRIPQQMSGYADEASLYRENCLKNSVMRIINEIRVKRKRPKFIDFFSLYKDACKEKGVDKSKVKQEF